MRQRSRDPLVLIVDDNGKNRKLARDVLRAGGLRTLEAGVAPRRSRSRPSRLIVPAVAIRGNGVPAPRQIAQRAP